MAFLLIFTGEWILFIDADGEMPEEVKAPLDPGTDSVAANEPLTPLVFYDSVVS